jgi:hypothetical protein
MWGFWSANKKSRKSLWLENMKRNKPIFCTNNLQSLIVVGLEALLAKGEVLDVVKK